MTLHDVNTWKAIFLALPKPVPSEPSMPARPEVRPAREAEPAPEPRMGDADDPYREMVIEERKLEAIERAALRRRGTSHG